MLIKTKTVGKNLTVSLTKTSSGYIVHAFNWCSGVIPKNEAAELFDQFDLEYYRSLFEY